MSQQLLEGVSSATVVTSRLRTHVLTCGPEDGAPVLFIQGNLSSARFWEETMPCLPHGYRAVAPDLRGFGGSELKPVDATRGLRDFSDDLHSLMESIAAEHPIHIIGWSMGGGVAMQYSMDHPDRVSSLVLVAPVSPYGLLGTRDASGTPCWADYAGSGGGSSGPEFVKRLASGDRSEESDLSPRNIMNRFFFRPPFRPAPEREEVLLSAILSTQTGEGNYPGDGRVSENWPGAAPGSKGILNAMSPRYCDLSGFSQVSPSPDVLWVRGDSDLLISDTCSLDPAVLGQIGLIPGWPGAAIYPPQPMLQQTRAVLDAYKARGGRYREVVLSDCGHAPHIEKPDEFRKLLIGFLEERRQQE